MERPTSYTFRVYKDPDVSSVPQARLEAAFTDLVKEAKLPFGLYTLKIERVRTTNDKGSPYSTILIQSSVYIGCYRCVFQLSRENKETFIGTVTVPPNAISSALHQTLIKAGASLTDTDWGERVAEPAVVASGMTREVDRQVLERVGPRIELTGTARAIANAAMMQYAPDTSRVAGQPRAKEVAVVTNIRKVEPTSPARVVETAAAPPAPVSQPAEVIKKPITSKTRRAATTRQPSLLARLAALEQAAILERALVRKKFAALTTELADFDSLIADIRKKKEDWRRDRLLRKRIRAPK